jgi:hypothetical protein
LCSVRRRSLSSDMLCLCARGAAGDDMCGALWTQEKRNECGAGHGREVRGCRREICETTTTTDER